jgi:hypothetical protein
LHSTGLTDQLPPRRGAQAHRGTKIAAVRMRELVFVSWRAEVSDGRVEIDGTACRSPLKPAGPN